MIAGAADFNDTAKKAGWPALCDASVRFTHPDLRRLLGVWRRQARRGVPSFGEMTPRLLRSFLPDIAIYERVVSARRRWRVELMGSSFAQILGDMTGNFLDEMVEPGLLPRWHGSLDAAYGEGAPLRFLARTDTKGMTFLAGEYLTAPLRAADGSASLVLAAGRFTGGRRWQDVETEARQALGT